MLVRLLYASRSVDTSAEAIESILNQARQHNPEMGITGILCYGGGIFLQAIEGGRMHMAMLATIIAGFWSLMSGTVVVMALAAIGIPAG